MKKKISMILFFGIIFGIIGYISNYTNITYNIDNNLIKGVQQNISPQLTTFFKTITFLGAYQFYIFFSIVIIIFMIIKKKKKYIPIYLVGILASTGINKLIKEFYKRERPTEYFLVKQGGYSFPSGHTMVTTTVFLVLAYILSKEYPKKSKFIYFIAWIYILLMGISRIYLGVHWPTDIIGGIVGGSIVFLLVTFLDNKESK